MLGAFQRLLPFIGRPKRKDSTLAHTFDEPALTVNRDSQTTGSWCTVQSDRESEPAPESKRDAAESTIRSGNLITEAVSLLRRRAREEYVVDHDVSNGREYQKVEAVSYRRNDKAPKDFHYVTSYVQWKPVYMDTSLAGIAHCMCKQDCRETSCSCSIVDQASFRYDTKGRLASDFNVELPPMIRECNAACGCNPKLCKNMVIQRGPRCRVVLFRTKSRGWGVRTLETLKRGTFVGIYTGELLSSKKSMERQDDTYLFNLASSQVVSEKRIHQQEELRSETREVEAEAVSEDEDGASSQDEEKFVCDAKFFGNYTRFINHSCSPNLIGIKSFTEHQDYRFPHIAFFTCKDIAAFSELTLNYGDSYWLVKCKRDSMFCRCRQPQCRFSKKSFPKTLKEHSKAKAAHK